MCLFTYSTHTHTRHAGAEADASIKRLKADKAKDQSRTQSSKVVKCPGKGYGAIAVRRNFDEGKGVRKNFDDLPHNIQDFGFVPGAEAFFGKEVVCPGIHTDSESS